MKKLSYLSLLIILPFQASDNVSAQNPVDLAALFIKELESQRAQHPKSPVDEDLAAIVIKCKQCLSKCNTLNTQEQKKQT